MKRCHLVKGRQRKCFQPLERNDALAVSRAAGCSRKASRSNWWNHMENGQQQNPKLNALGDTALSFQKTSGHLITMVSSSQGTAIRSSKKTFLEASRSHGLAFQHKRYLWPCGVGSRPPEPEESACQDLQHVVFTQGMGRRLGRCPYAKESALYTRGCRGEARKFPLRKRWESCTLERTQMALSSLKTLPGHVGQQAPGCSRGFLQ